MKGVPKNIFLKGERGLNLGGEMKSKGGPGTPGTMFNTWAMLNALRVVPFWKNTNKFSSYIVLANA